MKVVVTGAAHGIGHAIAGACRDRSWDVIAVDIDGPVLTGAFADDPGVTTVVGSVHADAVESLIATLDVLADRSDVPIDGLVNNVGVSSQHHWDNLTRDDVDRALDTNVIGPWMLTKWWAEKLSTAGQGGSALFVTSLHAERVRLFPDYSMSKAAVSMLVREAAVALAPHGIRVNALVPGAINTWHDSGTEPSERDRQSAALIPLGRLGVATDLAGAAAYLLDSTQSGYVTGAELCVDGGLNLHNWLMALGPEH